MGGNNFKLILDCKLVGKLRVTHILLQLLSKAYTATLHDTVLDSSQVY